MSRRKTIEAFIQKARKIHGDIYDYSKFMYINNSTKGIIICPEHGDFTQRSNAHLSGQGCPACGKKLIGQYNKPTTEEFIQRAKQIHGNKYDYSSVEYVNAHHKVIIICPEHGEFYPKPYNHLNGSGCPECYKLTKKTINEFITASKQIHDNTYDYSLIDYINTRTKVCIICPVHGEFWQNPHNHTRGRGCPTCSSSKGEKAIAQWLNKHKFNYDREYKFNDCRNINPLPFDFYLPTHNILIEYDGIQHYEPVDHFGGIVGLEGTQKHDKIKTNYCLHNDIQLIRIPYFESIEDILSVLL